MENKAKIDGMEVDGNKIFVTSDSHFGHTNIIKFNNRPYKNADQMNEDMIRLWNEIVPEDGHVFHLGDVSLMSPTKTENLLYRLNGKIYLLKGNHEKSVLRKESTRNRFEWIKERYEFYVPHNGKKHFVVMSHYAHRVWNKSHHGSIHLYGHSHAGLEDQPWGKSMDVGVDNALRLFGQCRPFKLDEVMSIMEKREIKNAGDHHK